MEKSKVEIVKTIPLHIEEMKGKLRDIDKLEIYAVSRKDPDDALVNSVDMSEKTWTVIYDDEPVAVFGVAKEGLLSTRGIPWMLGTPGMLKIKKDILLNSKIYIYEMSKGFTELFNYVHEDNLASKRWLKWCGFSIAKAIPYGIGGEPFHRFSLDTGGNNV